MVVPHRYIDNVFNRVTKEAAGYPRVNNFWIFIAEERKKVANDYINTNCGAF